VTVSETRFAEGGLFNSSQYGTSFSILVSLAVVIGNGLV
jgi:hypothetical protein